MVGQDPWRRRQRRVALVLARPGRQCERPSQPLEVGCQGGAFPFARGGRFNLTTLDAAVGALDAVEPNDVVVAAAAGLESCLGGGKTFASF